METEEKIAQMKKEDKIKNSINNLIRLLIFINVDYTGEEIENFINSKSVEICDKYLLDSKTEKQLKDIIKTFIEKHSDYTKF